MTRTLDHGANPSLVDAPLAGFAIAAGSTRGTEHRRTNRPNQDAAAWRRRGGVVAAVVTDGCGSGRHNELGARLGAALWVEALCRWAPEFSSPLDPSLFRVVRREVTAHLRSIAGSMGGSLRDVVADHFLFTVVGCVIAGDLAVVHAVGDGLFAIDGAVTELGPFPDNQPPYIGYDLLGAPTEPISIAAAVPVAGVESIALATDGALELDSLAELCGPRYTRNRDAIRRRLELANREQVVADWDARRLHTRRGALSDDTTVLVIRPEAA